jgi:sugar phosphate isomerase/epimerase
MFKNLNTGAIGVKATLAETIDYARRHGFAGIDFSITEAAALTDQHGVSYVRDLFAKASIKPGSWGFPVEYRRDAATWQEGMKALPKLADLARQLGCFRSATWILPGSDDRDFAANFAFHVARLAPAAAILKDHGHCLGLEFIGPKTLRTPRKHLFVYTLDGMLALGAAMGAGNVGLLLDIWHLYTSHGDTDDVRKLSKAEIVSVHVNDAPTGKAVDEQIDNVRALPAETGVLAIADFLHALADIHYDGPVTAEPFSQRVRDLPPEQAVSETAAAMHKSWALAGLS